MARTAITVVTLNRDTPPSTAAPDAIDQANGMKVAYDVLDELILIIANTAGAAKDVTIKAGDLYPTKILGDMVVEIADTTGQKAFWGLDQLRFKNADGYVYIDFEAGMTGTVLALKQPR